MRESEQSVDEPSPERVARNNVIFRSANDQIRAAADQYDGATRIPFICECTDERCREIILLTRAEYERIRAVPTHFLNCPGHEAHAAGWAEVVEQHSHYVTVEKLGRAAEIVDEVGGRDG